ncbi:DNA-binding response regulator [Streptomyces nojiriensis]|uniref:Sensory transduction protein RegX3 n=1 Tax=Streptomyces nojiriensis TaxID=66374 RepID=A0ABQ3SWZ8_9ACTN|nr:response regulator transcription factor [Streptomyces nojiriensis]QTI46196.1 Sensory transduction protein regX3 [Streptomyces nojiriensis]GGR87311.1 DNA-binding response regulator [Streptomyces nojiriensis]GHI72674.1 DNA-binding response regulator [Streptomyces nojiriensis]
MKATAQEELLETHNGEHRATVRSIFGSQRGAAAPPPPPPRNVSDTWRVLVAESNKTDRATLTEALARHGHDVTAVNSGGDALASFETADLVLLDLDLPDLDGLEVCREIRAARDIPVIAVTSQGSELDCVLALQAGADDYVIKPYGLRELMARLNAVMRRSRQTTHTDACADGAAVLEHGPLRIDSDSREVEMCGQPVPVTRKEFDLLALLASTPGRVISRESIMHKVWGESWSRRTVDTHVSSLRSKLGGPDWIITVRGVGFKLRSL